MKWARIRAIAESKSGLLGYKVVRREGNMGISGADSRLRFPLQLHTVIRMPGKGIYLSPNERYVRDYYAGHHEKEALLTLAFSPENIVWGNLVDRESEVAVSEATIVAIEELNAESD